MSMSPQTVLQRVPNLKLQIDSDNIIHIKTAEGVTECGYHGLAVLDAFYRPRALGEVLEQLRPRVAGAQDWINLTSTIAQLYHNGVLFDSTRTEPMLVAESADYDAAPIHVAMLNDRSRVESFLAGIRDTVRPGDVVVDVGTGSGIFAIAAAQAGARHVYAIEASNIGRLAEQAFAANGVADRITLLPGWSTELSLPERADVLVSEMIGNDPLSDYVLEVMLDARKRLLNPAARAVPGRVQVYALPVTLPQKDVMRSIFTLEVIENWRAWYGIDFSPFVAASQRTSQVFSVRPSAARAWPYLSEPVLLADFDLLNVAELMVNTSAQATATADGCINAVLIYFEVQLGPDTRLSLHPQQVPENSFRSSAVWVLGQPIVVRAGEAFAVSYTYRQPGVTSRVSVQKDQG